MTTDIKLLSLLGADRHIVPPVVCQIYFPGHEYCGGGVLALDGRTGVELWRLYSPHELFSLNCGSDLDQDGFPDCIAAGRVGVYTFL